MSRTYDMTNRARRAAETAERIEASTEALLREVPIAEVTLEAIAAGADVTVQTVLRHMGSRDGCIDAVGKRVRARIDSQRSAGAPGDIAAALSGLMAHYEAEGQLILNLLAQSSTEALAQAAAKEGRAYHRAWVKRCFGPLLSAPKRETVDALVAATDLYVWKLLRLDLGRSPNATEAVFNRLVRAVLEAT